MTCLHFDFGGSKFFVIWSKYTGFSEKEHFRTYLRRSQTKFTFSMMKYLNVLKIMKNLLSKRHTSVSGTYHLRLNAFFWQHFLADYNDSHFELVGNFDFDGPFDSCDDFANLGWLGEELWGQCCYLKERKKIILN